jgi:hypothetical protein
MTDAETARLAEPGRAWRRWGPYLAERAWGTVREDYSATGDAWSYFPHDHARSRAYRWSEDGLGGICDEEQHLCLAFAFWNGLDPILKERIFGLTNPQGNHGEDAKEYWWYLDSTPTHSWMKWRYLYPQAEFPYADLVAVNGERNKFEPEYELVDTGVLDAGYWDVSVDYAKAAPDDICLRLTARNAGSRPSTLHVLPTLWFRNTWSWGRGTATDAAKPTITAEESGSAVAAVHPTLGTMQLSGDGTPTMLFCENESNASRLWGVDGGPRYPKDGIGDRVLHGADTVNPLREGTKCALWYRLTVAPGEEAIIRLRLAPATGDLTAEWASVLAKREQEADAFYSPLTPADAAPGEASLMRQAFAGMLWTKQFFHYDVERWLDGDAVGPPPPDERKDGRNSGWRHLHAHDVISMPDKWEYPWFAAWDLAFHCVTLAHVAPDFAKAQLLTLGREWYMHPNGQLPAYEWDFGDVNPPVQAWAALRVFEIDGSTDTAFLRRIFAKLCLNFTWWVNREDAAGNNVFEGGFLGLDNIGPLDRSHLPVAGLLEQADGTAWMAMYCLNMLELALILARHDRTYEDVATKFFEHFTLIALAMEDQGLWDEADGFYYDVCSTADGGRMPLRAHSCVGLIPLLAVTVLDGAVDAALPDFALRMQWFLRNRPRAAAVVSHIAVPGRAAAALHRQPRAAAADSRLHARRDRVPLSARGARPQRPAPRATARHHHRWRDLHPRLRAGRVHLGSVRRQLQLARPGVDAHQPPHRRRAAALPCVSR